MYLIFVEKSKTPSGRCLVNRKIINDPLEDTYAKTKHLPNGRCLVNRKIINDPLEDTYAKTKHLPNGRCSVNRKIIMIPWRTHMQKQSTLQTEGAL